ncbi:MAG: co-chaperone GroES [Thermoanaerobaculia bacterium]
MASAKSVHIRPLDDRIVVRPEEAEEKTAGGILLPDAAKEKPARGRVVAVGIGKLLENGKRVGPALKVGDRVLYGKYSGSEVKIDGVEHSILRENEVLAVLE